MKFSLLILALSIISFTGFSQMPGGGIQHGQNAGRQMPTGSLYGKLVDSKTNKPIEYASVQLLQNRFDSATKKKMDVVIAGMLTRANGEFRLENVPVMGKLKLQVTVVGFKPYEQAVSFDLKKPDNGADMSAMMGAMDKDLGNIKIDIEEKVLDNVTVTANTSTALRLGIDRKVFNVDKNIVSAGGSAVDVMKNVPSVNVDLDGNVTMRNNAPQIFVDGRPTTMTLDQIPADIIENVEIITNPSAKFDASGGTSGIINVVLKKNKKVGYNGSVRASIDSRGKIGGGGDFNIRQEKINFFSNINYNQRKSINTGHTERTTFGTPNTLLNQDDKSNFGGEFKFIRGGLDFFVNNRTTLSTAVNIARGSMNPNSTSTMWTDILGTPVTSSLAERLSKSNNNFRSSGVSLSMKHNFPKSGQELTADINYRSSKNDNSNFITTDSLDYNTKNVLQSNSQRQDGAGTNKNIVFQLDYSNPINEKSKLEMGLRMSYRKDDNKNDFYFITPSGTAVYNALLSANYNSNDQVYAAYTTYSNQIKDFGYQLGLRVESSNYTGNLPDKNQTFNIKFPVSLFPSIFLSNKLKNDQELQLNYARKINRPNFWQLSPFTDYSDSLNISRGNPDLKPEFTNSFELSYLKVFKKNKDNFLASIYYKNTTDLITRFQVQELSPVTNKTILVNTYINASSSYVTGLELTQKTKMSKWWDLTANMNLFTSKINTGIAGQPEQEQFASWFGKLNNTFKLFKNFTMQLSAEYQSKTILPPGGSGGGGRGGGGHGGGGWFGQASSSQGYVRSNYFVDAGFRYEFLKNRQASISLNINDILRTRRSDVHSESPYFTQDVFRRRDPQVLRLSLNWRFGKFDPNLFKRKNNKNQGSDGMENVNMGGQ
ncbi:MAG TPA: TonB-dependent receptor [Chitinophagaceae bacterium]|nr:TonB-dependent receptor [Chitinophagaceae bacterium]